MDIRQVTDDYAVSGQIAADDIAAIKDAGFRSIICNRPDNEQPGQPSAAEIAVAAQAAELVFRHIPFVSGQMTEEDIAEDGRGAGRDSGAGLRLLPFRRALHQHLPGGEVERLMRRGRT